MKQTTYTLPRGRFARPTRFALVADLHGGDPTDALIALRERKPDYILMPGDIFESLDGKDCRARENALSLLRGAAAIAPTFYSTGNHEDGATHSWSPTWRFEIRERRYAERDLQAIADTGAILLRDEFLLKDGIAFGGLSSGLINENRMPSLAWLADLCGTDAPRVLLCHHPEYYETYLKNLPLDLVVSGHAHGGQWRVFGRGVFAPGQGLFPKYTAGVHDERLVVTTGLKKSKIPRFFNEREIVFIEIL